MEEESVPSRRASRHASSSRWDSLEQSNCRCLFALVVGLCALLLILVVQAISTSVQHTFLAGFWRVVSPWLFGIGAVVFVICAAIVGWHLYQVKLAHEERLERRKLVQENYAVSRHTTLLLKEARLNGDNVKVTYGEDGQPRSIEVIRSSILLEQARIQAEQARWAALEKQANRAIAAPAARPQLAPPAPSESGPVVPKKISVPGPYDLMDALRRFPLSEEAMFLAIDSDRQALRCNPALQLCHGALNAVTGRGKTMLIRGIETQLLKVGFEVVHADIKFAVVDEFGHDYRPIARALLRQNEMNVNGVMLPHLLLREDHIVHFLRWLAGPELQRRLVLYHQGQHTYKPFFLFLEELLYLIGKYKELGGLIGPLLSVGRSLGIKVFCAAQNFQVQNLKINEGMRENFESAWFLGGDLRSGAALLDMSVKELQDLLRENNIQLGKGVSIFRNNSVAHEARVVRGGMASNEFVYWLLGKADNFQLPEEILPVVDAGVVREDGLWVPSDSSGGDAAVAASPEALPMDEDLREALEAVQQGARGPRALERALGCTYYQAQKMWHELGKLGLVEAD